MDSAYEKEWEIPKLPGGVAGFMVLHIPIILLIPFATIELSKGTVVRKVLAIVIGPDGKLPAVVHELLVRRPDHFKRLAS